MKLIFEPEKWHACQGHDWRTCSLAVNCYSYILNRPDYYWAVPGEGFAKAEAQHFFKSFDKYFEGVSPAEMKDRLVAGAVKDGLLSVDEPVDREGYYLAALFLPEKELDFHWYRKDDNGTWSQKDGWHVASNKDAAGKLIHDPRDNPNLHYPVFGGFFLVPRAGVTLEQTFPLV